MHQLPIIILQKLTHQGEDRIALKFEYNKKIQAILKIIPGINWSQTHRCWHLPFNRTAYEILVQSTKDIATVDDILLRKKKKDIRENWVIRVSTET